MQFSTLCDIILLAPEKGSISINAFTLPITPSFYHYILLHHIARQHTITVPNAPSTFSNSGCTGKPF